jgi:hypothetical protein
LSDDFRLRDRLGPSPAGTKVKVGCKEDENAKNFFGAPIGFEDRGAAVARMWADGKAGRDNSCVTEPDSTLEYTGLT